MSFINIVSYQEIKVSLLLYFFKLNSIGINMIDKILLRIQKNFPLVERPFEEIAKELNTTEDKVLSILQEKKKENNVHILRFMIKY